MTLQIHSSLDVQALRETTEVEFKLAAGKDGTGKLPASLWETYSAMANTKGGLIFLGVKQNKDTFEIVGVETPDKVIAEFWNSANNQQVISVNLLKPDDVEILLIDDHSVIKIAVPRATRRQQPVHVGNNPFGGTYKRFNDGDYSCDKEAVKRMLAEQVEDARDSIILGKFSMEDLDIESFVEYRQQFKNSKPDHPWNFVRPKEFLRCIGGYRKDRDTEEEGLTLAGLLMFGKLTSIQEVLPNYFLDYQERPEAKTEYRWVDRITLDGTWSGNLYDFYRRVIRKLSSDLKVPFSLQKDQRLDDSKVVVALREALVNSLVHADFSGRISVLIVKRPDMFGFRNPGLMRVPIERAKAGGDSDCRNRLIHQMFMHVGLGERAGSGIPKIYSNWSSLHWREPALYEIDNPEQTLMELRMFDLLPPEYVSELEDTLGEKFTELDDLSRLVLVTTYVEGTITHSRIMEITDVHPHDLTHSLSTLVKSGLLESTGSGRGTSYFPPGSEPPKPGEAFGFPIVDLVRVKVPRAPDISTEGPDVSEKGPDISEPPREQEYLEVLTLSGIQDTKEWSELARISDTISGSKRSPRADVENAILELCSNGRYLTLKVLQTLLNRSGDVLRKHYLNPMVKSKKLKLAYPTKPNHPKQAYSKSE